MIVCVRWARSRFWIRKVLAGGRHWVCCSFVINANINLNKDQEINRRKEIKCWVCMWVVGLWKNVTICSRIAIIAVEGVDTSRYRTHSHKEI